MSMDKKLNHMLTNNSEGRMKSSIVNMSLVKAKKILENNGICWANYFDLVSVEFSRDNWIGCEDIKQAIDRIKYFITIGK